LGSEIDLNAPVSSAWKDAINVPIIGNPCVEYIANVTNLRIRARGARSGAEDDNGDQYGADDGRNHARHEVVLLSPIQ
jgi:hypothetical protein